MSKQLFLFLISLSISNQILALTGEIRRIDSTDSIASPERTNSALLSPKSTDAPSPISSITISPDCTSPTASLAVPADSTEEKIAENPATITINWDLILLNSPAGLAERVKFAQYYINSLKNRNLQLTSFLLNQVCLQIDFVKSAAADNSYLAEIKVAVYQIDNICQNNSQTYAKCYACTESTTDAPVVLSHSTKSWQIMPLPCTVHFSDDDLTGMINILKISAFLLRKTSTITQLDPAMVSHRVTAACDYRLLRFLKIHMLAQKHVTPDNITWLQGKILDKFCTIDKPTSPSAKPADLADKDHELCDTEWTILLA